MNKRPIPDAALEQHLIVLGKTGSGKSSVLRLLVEGQLSKQEPVCIIDPNGGTVALTDAGRAAAAHMPPPTVEEMQESLCRKVGDSKARIVRALIDIYPRSIQKDELAERIGVSPTSGGYFNNLGSLRTLGVIDYPAPGQVAALPVLFLE